MTDREMVEFAAKAVGYEGTAEVFPSGYVEMGLTNHFDRRGSNVWAPLHDDAQAFHLAVDLRLCLLWPERDGTAYSVGAGQAGCTRVPALEALGTNDAASTRRAIVRAAAEIGRAMP